MYETKIIMSEYVVPQWLLISTSKQMTLNDLE